MRADGEVERGAECNEAERSYYSSLPNFARSCAERQRTDGEVLLRPLYSLLAKVHVATPLSRLSVTAPLTRGAKQVLIYFGKSSY